MIENNHFVFTEFQSYKSLGFTKSHRTETELKIFHGISTLENNKSHQKLNGVIEVKLGGKYMESSSGVKLKK
jgi:hypothetical protein